MSYRTARLSFFVLAASFLNLVAQAQVLNSQDVISGMANVLSEEFNGNSLDESVWTIRGSQSKDTWNRFIYNDSRVTNVEDGALVCRAIKTPDDITEKGYTKEMITGAVTSTGKFAFTYGYIEARIKTKQHPGNFPAFWLMPEKKPNGWYGEIDIWETFNMSYRAYHTVHSEYTLYVNTNTTHQGSVECDYDDQWHTLGVLREPEKITFFFDGVSTYVYKKSSDATILEQGQWPFDVKYHIILNQSVGNGDNPDTNKPDLDFTYETQFDYVRVYQNVSDAVHDGNLTCPMNDWDSTTGYCNICGGKCEHPETYADGHCTTCGYDCNPEWDDATGLNKETGEPHNHSWSENGQCTGCGYRCTHDFSASTTCALCGQERTVFMHILDNIYDRSMEDYNLTAATTIGGFLSKLNDDGSFNDINYDDTRVSGWPSGTLPQRLAKMVGAYARADKSFRYHGNDTLYNAIKRAMTFWYTKQPHSENWYNNQIGWPQYMGLALCMMRKAPKHLPSDIERQMLNFWISTGGDPVTFTGANKQDIALQWIYRAVLEENIENLDYAVSHFNQPLTYTAAEGIQHDYSYQQHSNQYYPEGYGKSLLTAFFKTAFYLKDTKYQTSEMIEPVSNFLRHCFIPMNRGIYTLYNGVGRGIANPGNLNVQTYRANYNRMALLDPLNADFYGKAYSRLEQNNNANLEPLHYHYYRSDYALHQRPGFTIDFRTYSTRTCRAERGNGQGLKNYFLADGGTEIVVDGNEYVDIFPVWDWALIPGTTTPHLSTIPNYGDWGRYGTSTFTGGVSDGRYGFATYHLNDTHDEVMTSGYKSIFFFDNEVVCLGTNIASTNTADINTTVNQCLLQTDVTYSTGDNETVTTLSEQGDHNFTDLRWLNQGKVTYHFPDNASIRVSNKKQSGNWSAINWNIDKTAEMDVFTAYFNHGIQPTDGNYTYYIIPNTQSISEAQTSLDELVTINTHSVQAVYNKSLGMLQMVFHEAAPLDIEGMRIYPKKPCAMMLTGIGTDDVKSYISDPSYTLANMVVTMTVNGAGETVYQKVWGVELPTTPDLCGKTIDCRVAELTDCSGDECEHRNYTNGFCDICHSTEAAPLVEGVYEVSNAGQLAWIAEHVNNLQNKEIMTENVILTNDIDFGEKPYNWPGIGHYASAEDYKAFGGIFDGKGHEIRNFYMQPRKDYSGLFNFSIGAVIKNFTIRGEINIITKRQYVGSVLGLSKYDTGVRKYTSVEDVHSLVNIHISEATFCKHIGGIIGQQYSNGSIIDRCRYSGTINATDSYYSIGGIAGNIVTSTIKNCLFDGRIISVSTETSSGGVAVGGILGSVAGGRNIYILNCLSNGTFDLASVGKSGAICGDINIQNNSNYYTFSLKGSHYTTTGVHVANGDKMEAVGFYTQYAVPQNLPVDISEGSVLNDGTTLRALGIANWCQDAFTDGHYPYPSAQGFTCNHECGRTEDNLCNICWKMYPDEADGFYHIVNERTLQSFSEAVNGGTCNAHAVVGNDITLTGYFDNPIGLNADCAFTGVFDGQGHSISGLMMKSSEINNIGLFGFVGNTSTDPVIKNFTISGTIEYTGTGVMNCGVVSTMQSGTLQSIHSELNIIRSNTNEQDNHVGGILGFVDTNKVPVKDHPILVDKCWFSGSISSRNTYGSTAGIVGQANQYVTISNCLMTGTLTNTYTSSRNCQIGGILGFTKGSDFQGIRNCLSAGTIIKEKRDSTNFWIGALVARDMDYSAKQYSKNYFCPADGGRLPAIANQASAVVDTLTTKELADGTALQRLGTSWGQVIGVDAWPKPLPFCTIIMGDVNSDGKVDIADVAALVSILKGEATDRFGKADVSGDTHINQADIDSLIQIILNQQQE